MLSGDVIGPIATPSRSRKCPSQPSFGVQATLSSVGAAQRQRLLFADRVRLAVGP